VATTTTAVTIPTSVEFSPETTRFFTEFLARFAVQIKVLVLDRLRDAS
jgi:hypothetical protein